MTDYKAIRKALHEHPQTAGDEQFAHDTIVRHLQGLHPDKVYTHVGGWGVIAVWGKDPTAPTIAFRADLFGPALFAAACCGGCIGFLWFNSYPADIFMGDTGSLALGTAFAAMAVITKTEVVSLFIGGLFVVEALSVIIQVVHYKRTKRRIFLMAPIHHHFEKKGWSETKVVQRFWIITGAFASFGFVLYFAGTLV